MAWWLCWFKLGCKKFLSSWFSFFLLGYFFWLGSRNDVKLFRSYDRVHLNPWEVVSGRPRLCFDVKSSQNLIKGDCRHFKTFLFDFLKTHTHTQEFTDPLVGICFYRHFNFMEN